jgi:PilZ domain
MTDDDNKRIADRSRVLKGAKIVSMNNWSVVDCQVRDLSETGARLIVGDQTAVPNAFYFLLTADNTIRDAKVVWRKELSIGIHFTSEPRRAPARKFS